MRAAIDPKARVGDYHDIERGQKAFLADIDKKLKDRFGEIGGVAAADVTGGDVREIQVQIKKDKLLAYGIGITDVQRAITAANHGISDRGVPPAKVSAL